MKRASLFAFLAIFAFASCDVIKQNNLFEVINKKPEFLVSVSVSGYRSDECTASVTPERQVNGDRVTLYALPGPRSRFLSWERTSGVGDLENLAAATTSFTIRASAASLVANFGRALHELTLSPSTTRGAMRLDGVAFSGTGYLEDDTEHVISAVPSTNPTPYQFVQWVSSGEGIELGDSTEQETTIRLTANGASIAPRFANYTTTISVNPTSDGPIALGRTVPQGNGFKAGVGESEEDAYYIRAIPNEGARFLGWELVSGQAQIGKYDNEAGTSVNCRSTTPVVILARFAPIGSISVTINLNNPASSAITFSSEAAILSRSGKNYPPWMIVTALGGGAGYYTWLLDGAIATNHPALSVSGNQVRVDSASLTPKAYSLTLIYDDGNGSVKSQQFFFQVQE